MMLRISDVLVRDYSANPRSAHIPTQTSVSKELTDLNPDMAHLLLYTHLDRQLLESMLNPSNTTTSKALRDALTANG